MSPTTLILGTRGSELALTQTDMVMAGLGHAHPHLELRRQIIQTAGDKRPDLRFAEFSESAQVDKGIFIKELEIALERGEIHAAVHSLKDVPSDLAAGFALAAVLPRAPIEDVLVSREPWTLQSLPPGARIGTSSVRRASQLRWLRPDVATVEIRGNVPTRVRKVLASDQGLEAVLLAAAGLRRLGLLEDSRVVIDGQALPALVLDAREFLPAAGQGAIAIESRAEDQTTIDLLRALNHAETEARVVAEREFLRLLGAGCQTPVGAYTWTEGATLHMAVRVFDEQNSSAAPLELAAVGTLAQPKALAADMAAEVCARGYDSNLRSAG